MPCRVDERDEPETPRELWNRFSWSQRWGLLALAGWFAIWPPRLVRFAVGMWKVSELGVGQKQRVPIPARVFDGYPPRVYLRGESRVDVETFTELHDWLVECRYALDSEVYGCDDHWAHPSRFEQLRRGDCEDHAIWAWRKLVEMSLPAWLVIGRTGGHTGGSHAWVRFAYRGKVWVYESTDKVDGWPPLMSLRQAYENGYRPYYSVDHELRTFVHREMFEPIYEGERFRWIDEVGVQEPARHGTAQLPRREGGAFGISIPPSRRSGDRLRTFPRRMITGHPEPGAVVRVAPARLDRRSGSGW